MTPNTRQILILVLSILLSFASQVLPAQNGANVQAGTMLMQNRSADVTDPGEFHSGFYVGLNGRFGSYTFYLSPGAYYYRLDVNSSDKIGFFQKKERFTMVKIPIDIGVRVIRNPVFNFRVYGGGVLNYIESVDEDATSIDLEEYNDIHFGINAGLGVDLWWLTLDVKYEKGISGMLISDRSTSADYLSAGLGIFF